MGAIDRPTANEYAGYYARYIQLVPEGDILRILPDQLAKTRELLSKVDEERALFRYTPGKWMLKEVVGHVIDTERVFAFRSFAFSRNDRNLFPGMEQDEYASGANYPDRPLREILDEFTGVRGATMSLFKSFNEEMMMRKGIASGSEFSVRSIMYIIAGHELHHVKTLRERYLT